MPPPSAVAPCILRDRSFSWVTGIGTLRTAQGFGGTGVSCRIEDQWLAAQLNLWEGSVSRLPVGPIRRNRGPESDPTAPVMQLERESGSALGHRLNHLLPSHGDQPEDTVSRWWMLGVFATIFAIIIPPAFGRVFSDTKIDLVTSPQSLLSHLLNLWDPNGWFGFLQDQYQGYAFPDAPFFALGHYAAVPPWLMQRLWMALLFTVGFWGAVRLAEALKIGSRPTRVVAGLAFALWPTFTILIGPNSQAIAPGILLPWVMIPLVRGCKEGSTVRAAALSAFAVLLMGGVNAADTLDVLIMPALFLLTRQRSPRRRSLSGWWLGCVALATVWWLIPLLFLGKYGFNFLPYIEQAATTTSTASAASTLQGTSDWIAYLNSSGFTWDQAGLALVTLPVALFGSALAAGAGLFGLARRDLRERRFLLLAAGLALALMLIAYWGPLGGPFGSVVRPLLNGSLQPFRNIYKFEPLLILPLALGIAHALHVGRREIRRVRTMVVVSVLSVATLAAMATPYLLGRAVGVHSFSAIPAYWYKTADYLAQHAPHTTALVLPASAHGFYVWGWPVDEPLEAIAKSPWIDRGVTPFGGAGSTRVVDAVDQALRTGIAQPGLAALLKRAGISYVVDQNDVQWQLSDSPSPLMVNRILTGPGFSLSASFGPMVRSYTDKSPTLKIVASGYQVAYPAVEIFKVNGASSPVASYPTASAALVSGGPEAELQLFNQGVLHQNQGAVMAGNWMGGTYKGPLWAVTDSLRRENYQFGLVNDNFSYTLTRSQTVPAQAGTPGGSKPPRQMLPYPGVEHQTVTQFAGVSSVDASSYGSWIFSLPEYNPANVFDGDSSTAWAAGSAQGSVGEWIQATLLKPTSVAGTHIELLTSPGRPTATEVRVSTDRGSVTAQLKPTGAIQPLATPAGKATWLRVTFVKVTKSTVGGADAGIRQISIPGVHAQAYLRPPQEALGRGAAKTVFSFQNTQVDPTSVLREAPEPVMARTFSTTKAGEATATGTALPKKGGALDSLLGSSALHISASSTLGNLPNLRPQNLLDEDISTNWIANGEKATLNLNWPQPAALNEVSVVFTQSLLAARPQEIVLSSPAGTRLLRVPQRSGGAAVIKFPTLTTDQLTVTFPQVAKDKTVNSLGGLGQAPVGLAELEFPALKPYQIHPPNPVSLFAAPCGSGPSITVDGRTYETSLQGTYADLYDLQPLDLTTCTPVTLAAGTHRLLATPTSAPYTVAGLALSTTATPGTSSAQTTPSSPNRTVSTTHWGPENRSVRMGAGARSYLEVHQNYNTGWTAMLNGKKLQPVVLDGWQQGFIVPAGPGGVVRMTFAPETPYLIGLAVGALGVLLLLVLGALSLRRRSRLAHWREETAAAGPWSRAIPAWLAIGLVAVMIFLIGGPLVLGVPVLVLVGRRWPRSLPWIALVGMAIVGVVSAVHPGNGAQSQTGSFSVWAQAATVLSVAAVFTPVLSASRRSARQPRHRRGHAALMATSGTEPATSERTGLSQ